MPPFILLHELHKSVVPVMLPSKGLSDEYVMPQWWCPTRAEESALVEPTSGDTSPGVVALCVYDGAAASVVGASKVKGSEEDIFA